MLSYVLFTVENVCVLPELVAYPCLKKQMFMQEQKLFSEWLIESLQLC